MSKLDRKKFREDTVKYQQYRVDQDEFENFEGNIFELYLLKFARYVSRNRKSFFIGVGVFILALVLFVGYGEISRRANIRAVEEFEKIEKIHQKNSQLDLTQKIKDYKSFYEEYSGTDSGRRALKVLADLYARNGEFQKAASYMEDVGKKIDSPKEIKAYYFYIAGNYREMSGEKVDIDKAIQNFSIASSLLQNNEETIGFRSWSLYHQGRLKLLNSQKKEGIDILKKVIGLESKSDPSSLTEVKELSLYLILKSSNPTTKN